MTADGRKERDPDSWTARIGRWWMTRFKGYKVLLVFEDDPNYEGEVLLTENLVKSKDVPHDAVRVVDVPYTMIQDRIKVRYDPHDENFSARHVALYMESNKVSNAVSHEWGSRSPFDKRILLMVAVGAVVIGCYVYAVMM